MACPLWATLLLFFFGVLLQAEENVFVKRKHANTIFGRAKRANSYLKLEEMMQGNLERECNEELCSYEEAREVFEDDTSTLHKFWKNYQDDYTECHKRNGYCDQFCSMENGTIQCSCTTGYTLGENGKSCIPSAEQFVCGKLYSGESRPRPLDVKDSLGLFSHTRIKYCKPGGCPWQAVLVDENDEPFCGGVILNKLFVLTAAHCLQKTKLSHIIVGAVDTKDINASTHAAHFILQHSKFDGKTHDYDIALVKLKEAISFSPRVVPACIPEVNFTERVLMTQTFGYTTSFTCTEEYELNNTNLQLDYVPFIRCPESGIHNHSEITENMFCAGSNVVCQEGYPGPHITLYKDTYFVTGIGSWRRRLQDGGVYDVFTKVSNFMDFIENIMSAFNERM